MTSLPAAASGQRPPSPLVFRRRLLVALALGSLVLAGAVLSLDGCARNAKNAAFASLTPAFLDFPVPARIASTVESVQHGKQVYEANCVQCHGASGRGDGYGAPFQVPTPRDFTTGEYKFRTTESGRIPTDEDLFRTISRGADGTGMPPWSYLLSAEDRWALVDYVKTFSPRFAKAGTPHLVELPAPPAKIDVENGGKVYAKLGCAKCHGEDGRGVGPSSLTLVDTHNRHINSRDFTNPGSFRTGWTNKEIVRALLTGLNGTPMPTYAGNATTQEFYDLAGYVQSIAKAGSGNQKREKSHSMPGLGAPDRVIALREHAWKFEPAEIRIKKGEVVRIDFSATDNGLGVGHGFAIDGYDKDIFINGAMVGAPQSVTFRINKPGRYTYYCATQCSTEQLHPNMNGILIVE